MIIRRLFAYGLVLYGLTPGPSQAQSIRGTVLSIGDADTLRVREGSRTLSVRLACIDAAQISQTPHGTSAGMEWQALAPVGAAVN